MQKTEDPWIRNVKDEGIMAATASLGLIYLWDINGCSSVISDYLDLKDGFAKAGACIGIGLANSGIWSEVDPAKGMLEDVLENTKENCVKLGAIMGLGLAYAGTARDDLTELISNTWEIVDCPTDIGVNTALSLAMINVGKCNEEVVNSILDT